MEKDELRGDVQKLTKELSERGERLRHLTATHKMLLEENNALVKEINELSASEEEFDRGIEQFKKMSIETENLRNMVDENEFITSEQLFMTQMKLEENGRKQLEIQIKDLAERLAIDNDLAKEYLKKYIISLEKELSEMK